MIVFLTLLLGLVTGPRIVEVIPGPGAAPVATVELLLDGGLVARRDGPPWHFVVDFGDELAPHRLVAVARDADGAVVATAEQAVNLPRPPVEARWTLAGGEPGEPPRTAALYWEVLWPAELEGVEVVLDGERLDDVAPGGFDLPPLDPEDLHVLSAELTFEDGLRATAEVAFGGAFGERVESELTAVPVRHDGPPPSPASLSGRLRVAGEAPRVVAVEAPGGDVVLVADRESRRHLRELVAAVEASYGRLQRRTPRDLLPLAGPDRLRFVWPVQVAAVEGSTSEGVGPEGERTVPPHLFGDARGTAGSADLAAILLAAEPAPVPQRLADAVAVAGSMAASGNRPRVVVLVVDPATPDPSRHGAPEVRRYLERLRVPLEVWRVGEGELAGWGPGRPVDDWQGLQSAVRRLRQCLRSQAVVWLEGDHLPTEVVLSRTGEGLALAGTPDRPGDPAAVPGP